ncbi:hypothetical protein A3E04_01890 [Candidatus Kuenenbacteria bacterium RIFCSPHIGHO2_12_FULL_42_14]|uniref:Extracellular ligand-binding receptor n=2 Tax=Candidatus Kueneniibacteriota TaxID=1752740 RepID=A0A0G0YSX4_9BACT|nr:MAG: Extracellular ligand-binding receptor [Candidatus Kuenenbacteria bacterium GW2011_GWA2_42_15]OGG89454.1 MAG: hypothetical protein A3C68_02550 [Candidatus Kuenenbacteria bacterium RIFCSPHIGHO2_02_FULL_42_29]OGG98612.1 MAG: hypothetical protein A3E04_01890 [Candidatus Kuenenbacteria bacterium RIFCSPHIGHO2_12_FULL_42_14]
MKKQIWIPILIIAVVIVGLVIFLPKSKKQVDKEPIKIGVILPLTGTSADAGQYVKSGLVMAEKEINDNLNLKYNVELFFEDSQYKSEVAVTAINKLISVDKINYIIGEYGSSQTLAITPIAEQNKVILLTPASQATKITTAGDFIFRTQTTAKQEADFFSDFVYKAIGNKRLNILALNTDYGLSYIENFSSFYEKIGGNLGLSQTFDAKEVDFRTILLKSKADKAEAVILTGNRNMNGLILKQIKELDLTFQLFATSVTEGKELLEIAGEQAEGLVYPYPFDAESENFAQKSFQERYQKIYGSKSEMLAANGYDTLSLLSYCFEKVGTEVEKVKNCLYGVKDYQGASGVLSFDKNGDVVKEFILKTIKNGQFVPYEK